MVAKFRFRKTAFSTILNVTTHNTSQRNSQQAQARKCCAAVRRLVARLYRPLVPPNMLNMLMLPCMNKRTQSARSLWSVYAGNRSYRDRDSFTTWLKWRHTSRDLHGAHCNKRCVDTNQQHTKVSLSVTLQRCTMRVSAKNGRSNERIKRTVQSHDHTSLSTFLTLTALISHVHLFVYVHYIFCFRFCFR